MRWYRVPALMFISVLFFQCQKDNHDVNQPGPVTPDTISATLQGNVYDENGMPAKGVFIKVGAKGITTDAYGNFRFDNASLDKKSAMVTAEKTGYFKAYRTFAATSGTNYIAFKLIKKTLVGTINAAAGGNVALSNGAKIVLPANSVVKVFNNAAYTGTVNVYAAYIDPTAADISQAIPGSFMADDKNGTRVTLASYGMMAVELQSTSGERLQIKSGSKATLTTPIPASVQSNAPATIALWSVNEQSGIWKEEGTATKTGNVYVGDVNHFSFWNCDVSINAIVLSLTIKTPDNQPLIHAPVRIIRTSANNAQSNSWTDALGQVSGYVPSNETLILQVLDPCNNVVFSQNIGPFTQNTNLGVINVTLPNNSFVTISGNLSNCSGANVTNGYAVIYYNNFVRFGYPDASGNFSTNFVLCPGAPTTAQVLGLDFGAQQQSQLTTVNVTTPATNVGNVSACAGSSVQYFNVTLDGTNYSYNSGTGDTLGGTTSTPPGSPGLMTQIFGQTPGVSSVGFFFWNDGPLTTGTYPLGKIGTNPGYSYYDVVTIPPSNVIITNFPLFVGQYYEGTLSGSFSHPTGIHTFNGSFRIRRNE